MIHEKFLDVGSKVLSYMLAPDHFKNDDTPFVLHQGPEGLALELHLRWQCARTLALGDPANFINELVALLKPISTAITYGEVVELRAQLADCVKKFGELQTEAAGLRRYKDAWELQQGKDLK